MSTTKHLPMDRRAFLASSAAMVAMGAAPALAQSAAADLVLVNARIKTMDPERPEATALAARNGTFVAVGLSLIHISEPTRLESKSRMTA
mgnify:CR=1 FL=1